MNDQEIRMWAVEQVVVANKWVDAEVYRDVDQVIDEAQKLYLFVTGKRTPVVDEFLK